MLLASRKQGHGKTMAALLRSELSYFWNICSDVVRPNTIELGLAPFANAQLDQGSGTQRPTWLHLQKGVT